jgi:hypothetical protein
MHAEFHSGNLKRENHVENLDINGRRIRTLVLKVYDVRVYTEWNLFTIRYSGRLFWILE